MPTIPGVTRQDQIQLGSMGLGVVLLEVILKYEPGLSGVLLPVVFAPFVGSMFLVGWWTKLKSGDYPALNGYVWPSREPPLFWFYIRPDEGRPIEGKPGKYRYPVRYPAGEEFTHRKWGKKKLVYVDVWGLFEEVVHPDKGSTTYHEIETDHGAVDRVFLFEKQPVVEDGQILPVYDLVLGSGNARQIDQLVDRVMTIAGRSFGGDVPRLLHEMESRRTPKETSGSEEVVRVEPGQA